MVEERVQRVQAEDALRQRRRNDTAVAVAVELERPSLLRCELLRLLFCVHGPDRLRRIAERRVGCIHFDERQERRDADVEGQLVAEFLLDDIADHSLGLRAEQVERVGVDHGVCRRLEREQPDLRPVAVRDHELVLVCEGRERAACGACVHLLVLCRQRLAAAEESVAT